MHGCIFLAECLLHVSIYNLLVIAGKQKQKPRKQKKAASKPKYNNHGAQAFYLVTFCPLTCSVILPAFFGFSALPCAY